MEKGNNDGLKKKSKLYSEMLDVFLTVRNCAARCVKDHSLDQGEVDDIVYSAFEKVKKAKKKKKAEETESDFWPGFLAGKKTLDEFKGYFITTIKSVVLDRCRKNTKKRGLSKEEEKEWQDSKKNWQEKYWQNTIDNQGQSDTKTLENREFLKAVIAKAGLTNIEKKILIASFWEDKPLTVIAVEMELAYHVVRKHCHEALEKTREASDQMEGGEI